MVRLSEQPSRSAPDQTLLNAISHGQVTIAHRVEQATNHVLAADCKTLHVLTMQR